MNVQNGGDDGIRGSGVNGFTLANSTVSGNGNAVNESGLDFVGGLTGTAAISSSTSTGSPENGMIVTDAIGSLNLTVTGSTLNSTSNVNTGNDGLHLDANDTANITASITNSTFSNNRGDHFQFSTNAMSSGTNDVTFSNNTLTGDRGTTYGGTNLGAGVTISTDASSHTTYTIANNNIHGAVSSAIAVDLGTNSTASGTLTGKITGNTIATPGTFATKGLFVSGGAATTDGGLICARISDNSLTGSSANGATDFRLRQRFNTTVRLPGYGGAAGDTSAVVTFVQGNNGGTPTGSATVAFPTSGGGFVGGAACPTPP